MSNTTKSKRKTNIYKLTLTAILSAIAYVLMFLEVSVPFMPSFIKLDFSDFPGLLASLAVGPIGGIVVALVKNLLHLTITSTGGVGELSNFILNMVFILPPAFIYKYKQSKKAAVWGAVLGAAVMGVVSVISNYFVVYPIYYNFMPEEVILGAYQAILPFVKSILQSLIIFNMPFTFVKGMLSVIITFLIYNNLKPLLRLSREKSE